MKNNFQDYISGADGSANIEGDSLDTRNGVGVAFTANFAGGGTPSGVLHIDGKIKDGNWTSVASKNVTADGDYFIEKTDWLYEFVRLRYVRSSGSATVNAQACTKGF